MRSLLLSITPATRLIACAALLASAGAGAETAVYVGNIAPFSFPPEHGERGVLYDLMHEIALRAGHSGEVQVVPLRRELEILRLNPNALGVLARVPDREARYRWIVPLLREHALVITSAGSHADISTLDAARRLRVGVLLGGPSESAARRFGFTHIEATTSVANNARKLAVGRLDALVVLGGVAAVKDVAGKSLRWREGVVLESTDIYLAGNPAFDAARAQAWQAAFKTMRQDGSYQRIVGHYHYAPIK